MFISTLLLLITPPFTHSPFARLTACVGILRELGGGGKEHRRAHWPWQSGTLAGSCISAFLLVPQPGAAKSEGGDWFEDEVDRGTFPTVIFHNMISSGRRSGAEDFSSAGSWLHCMPVLGKFAFPPARPELFFMCGGFYISTHSRVSRKVASRRRHTGFTVRLRRRT